MAQDKQVLEEPWSPITKEERILHEILFYSQGPVDGYILGDGIRDLLLKSGLSLTVLSQIWNLADVSNNNVLTVHEFVLVMHLIRGVQSGRAIPKTLPRTLVPPKTTPQTPPPMSQQEKDAYLRVFQTLDYNRAGFIEAVVAAEMFLSTKLPPELLAQIWDLSEFARDGKLSPEKFAIACHLLRYAKRGGSLEGPVDIFQYAPQHISPLSLLARKRRVSEYEEHKQRLMSLKERRKVQAVREARRLDLAQEKVGYLQELYELLKKLGTESDAINDIGKAIAKDKADNEKQEEIALRLKKEHEKVRQETVKIILGEQKFNSDICIIKKDTDELNKRLMSQYTHATKDPDPFHQLFEQRKEKRQGSTIKDLDKIDIYIPFEFSPFDLSVTPDTLPSGEEVVGGGNNHKQSMAEIKSVIADLKEFGEEFMDLWGGAASSSIDTTKEFEDDEIFREVHDWSEDNWPNLDFSENGLLRLADPDVVKIKQKLSDMRKEITKLATEGGRLVFRKTEDYHARKKALEEEEKVEKVRVRRRSVTERIRTNSTGGYRYSYTGERKVSSVDSSQAAQAAREYRLKRRSQTVDSRPSSPETLRNLDREKRLYRTSTNQSSVSDECSLSRESSLSSFDQPMSFRGSHILEEESSTIRTQYSSRTDDSGILTLTSERKDDFYLEPSAGSSPVSYTNVETSDSSILTERIENLAGNVEVNKTLKTEVTTLPFTFTELQQEAKRGNHYDSVDTEKDKSTSPVTTRRSSKKSRAPVPPSASALAASLYDKPAETDICPFAQSNPERTLDEPAKSESFGCLSNNNDHIKYHSNSRIVNDTVAAHSSHRPNLTSENSEVKENTILPKTENTPWRPPRLKKRSANSESSNGSSSPTGLLPAADPTTSLGESLSADIQVQDTKSGPDSKSTQVEYKHDSKKEIFKNGPDTDLQGRTIVSLVGFQEHSTQKLSDLSKEGPSYSSDLKFSFDQITSELTKKKTDLIQEQHNRAQSGPGISSVLTDLSSNIDFGTTRKTTDRLTEMDNCIIQSQTKLTASQTHTSPNKDSLEENNEKCSTEPDDRTQSVSLSTTSAPPPLPSSAPPPLPTTSLPIPADISTDVDDEEVVTVEYTIPFTQIPHSGEDIDNKELPTLEDSFTYLNSSDKTSPERSSTTPDAEPAKVASTNNIKSSGTNVESPLSTKTISDLRSDFFGLKTRRPNRDVLEDDLLGTPTSASRYSHILDLQNEIADSKRIGHGNSVDSDVSDSVAPLSVGDCTLSPGDSALTHLSSVETPAVSHENKSSALSSTRRNISSNDSTESSFDESLPVSPTTSIGSSQRLKALVDDSIIKTPTTTSKTSGQDKQTTSSKSPLAKKISGPSQTGSMYSASKTSFIRTESSENSPSSLGRIQKQGSTKSNDRGDKLKPLKVVDDPKNVVTVKKNVVGRTAEVACNGSLTDLEMERQEVISQCMVTRKVNPGLLAPLESEATSPESVQTSGKSLRSGNPSEYGFVYSAERAKPTPEVGWSDKQLSDQKVNLYSENVLKEGDTTESVDRESIANLSTTKRQWENIFTSQSTSKGDTSTIKKKATPKWEVRLPYTEKHSPSATNQSYLDKEDPSQFGEVEDKKMFKKPVVTESAIEREIRLAHEREEMLRTEKEERQKLLEKQKNETFLASYATTSAESESNQPAFNELTEADRHPDLWRAEQSDRRQEQDKQINESHNINPNESIIEREIRLQKEREADIVRMRKQAQQLLPQPQQQHGSSLSEKHHPQHEELEDINHNETKAVSYENPVVSSSNEVENRIVRELQELKEREEEIRKLHSTLQKTQITDEIDGPKEMSSPVQRSSATPANFHGFSQNSSQVSWQKDVSSFLTQQRRESADSSSTHSTGRSPSDIIPTRHDVKVRPLADSYSDNEDKKPNYFQKQETPIAKEIRLTRDRENDLRKQQGLPEIENKNDNLYSSYGTDPESNITNSISRPHSLVQSDNSMKKFASSRLQQELQEQKEREMTLRNEGKIITTSEEHIQPLKFMEISAVDKTDGTLKRNFVTKKTAVSNNESFASVEQQPVTSPSGQTARKSLSVGPGGQFFSYRESRQTAESKIEKELREMKEREEELRKQRTGALAGTSQ